MKNLKKLILLTLIVITGYACSSDDDGGDSTEQNRDNIIGTWVLTASSDNGVDNPIEGCDELFTIIFTASQATFIEYDGDNCENEYTDSVDYTINGNTITVYGYESEIVTLNNTTLTIKDVDEGDVYIETYTRQ